MERDWAGLPSDIIHLISKKLESLSDLASFNSVCKPWHSNGSKSDPPHQLPWLLKSHSPNSLTFYSSSFGKAHTFHLSESSRKILTLTNQHLVYLNKPDNSLSLFNPLTREEISIPGPDRFFNWSSPVYVGKERIVLVWGSSGSEDAKLGFYNMGDSEWKTAKGEYLKFGHLNFDGKCYAKAKYRGCIDIIDDVTGEKLAEIAPVKRVAARPTICKAWPGSTYLIEASGEILLIFRAHDEYTPLDRSYFDIHRLDSLSTPPKWTQITGIDDHVIFLDHTRGFAIHASCFKGYKGNCIYFLKYRVEEYKERYVVCRYDVEEGRTEEMGCEVRDGGCCWFMPSVETVFG